MVARSVVLVVLDGVGLSDRLEGNAVTAAHTPHLDALLGRGPVCRLACHGPAVGLPEGVMGNSEVGHMTLGSGRVIWQDICRVDRAVADGSLARHEVLVDLLRKGAEPGRVLHLVGLVSPGAVHSVDRHYLALVDLAHRSGCPVAFHAILDGRDTPPRSAGPYLEELEEALARGNGRIASVAGRYYPMDRDRRWDRTQAGYRAIVAGEGLEATSAREALAAAYARDEGDEFVTPTVIRSSGPRGTVEPGDSVFLFNFRADRMRQLLRTLVDPDFSDFPRQRVEPLHVVTMTRYEASQSVPALFPPVEHHQTLGEVVSQAGRRQLRLAETEKYAHVTYFFSAGREEPFPGEDRILVPSPRVPTYDQQPEMSAPEVGERLVRAIASRELDLVVCNFANGDMVGHTGAIEAAVQAMETVDGILRRASQASREAGAALLITADHGNAEEMLFADGSVSTQHSTNPVPLLLDGDPSAWEGLDLAPEGALCDVAPSVLALMDLPVPPEMDGHSLLIDPRQFTSTHLSG